MTEKITVHIYCAQKLLFTFNVHKNYCSRLLCTKITYQLDTSYINIESFELWSHYYNHHVGPSIVSNTDG